MLEQNESLSERELEILRLVATGAANKEIARMLVISPNTVKVHLRNIFAKIGVSTRTEATLYAIQIGLISAPGAGHEAHEDTDSQETVPANPINANGASLAPESATGSLDTQAQPGTRRALRPWQIALAVVVTLLLIGSGVVSARMLLMPTFLPTVSVGKEPEQQPAQRWSEHLSLPSPRKGMGIAEYENNFYLIGGETGQSVDNTVLRYWPGEDRWEALADKPTAVTDVRAALIGEKIYVPGGRTAGGQNTDRLEVYDPRQNAWERKAPLPTALSAYALASFEGRLYLFGGKNGETYLSNVYIYNPEEDAWGEGSPMDGPRAFAQAVTVTGKIQVMGGTDGTQALTTHQAYFPARDAAGEVAWEDLAPLPEGRYAMGAGQLAGLVYLVGGQTGSQTNSEPASGSWQYLTQSDEWAVLETPPFPVSAYSALIPSGNFIYVFGGETANGLSEASYSYQAFYTISVPFIRRDE